MRREACEAAGDEAYPEEIDDRRADRRIRLPFCTWRGLLGLVVVTAVGAAMVQEAPDPTAATADGLALVGHSGLIDTLRFSADGRTLVSAGSDRTIRVWDLEADDDRFGAELARLSMDDDVTAAAISPDGRTVAVAGFHGPSLWDWEGDGPIRRPSRPTRPAHSVAFSPDGRSLAVGGYNGELYLVDVATGHVLADLPTQRDVIRGLAFLADGRRLVSLDTDGRLKTWDVASRREIETFGGRLEDRERSILTFALSPDGRDLALTRLNELDGRIEVWDVTSGTLRATCRSKPGGMIHALAFSRDGGVLASCSTNQSMSFWDPRTGRSTGVLEGATGWVRALDFAADGRWVATSTRPDEVLLRRIGLPRRHTAFVPAATPGERAPRQADAA